MRLATLPPSFRALFEITKLETFQMQSLTHERFFFLFFSFFSFFNIFILFKAAERLQHAE